MIICGICTLFFITPKTPSDASAALVLIHFFAIINAIVLVLPFLILIMPARPIYDYYL